VERSSAVDRIVSLAKLEEEGAGTERYLKETLVVYDALGSECKTKVFRYEALSTQEARILLCNAHPAVKLTKRLRQREEEEKWIQQRLFNEE
jgi:hypothetical protein